MLPTKGGEEPLTEEENAGKRGGMRGEGEREDGMRMIVGECLGISLVFS